jgi:hypothetical protein
MCDQQQSPLRSALSRAAPSGDDYAQYLFRALCAGRMAQTGESHNQALDELRRIPAGTPPIPEAADTDQAFLESCFLEEIGRCHKDRWRPRMLPFAVRSVTPRPHELVVRVPKEFLPDIIRGIMPSWSAEEEMTGAFSQVYGIPGLRARLWPGRVLLSRPGLAGRITIAASAGRWRKAARIAADLGGADGMLMPWLTRPHDWHPAEARWVASWPGHYSPDGWQYRNSRLASQILRRLPGLCPAPRAYYHDLWFNRFGDTCRIQFEWALGVPHNVILGRLLHPVFGPGARIAPHDGQSLEDCYAETATQVRVQCTRQPATWIDLRRTIWDEDQHDESFGQGFTEQRRRRRKTAEEKYGY